MIELQVLAVVAKAMPMSKLIPICAGLEPAVASGALPTREYLQFYHVLSEFLRTLGTVFSFITKDIDSKVEILEAFLDQHSEDAETLNKMLQYEVDRNITNTKKPSASRTLLRLHRALAFVALFLEKFVESEEQSRPSSLAQDAYNQTLSKHHAWLIRKSVGVALHALPSHEGLTDRIYGEDRSIDKDSVRRTIKIMDDIFQNVEGLFTQHDLHGLP
eukprot:m.109990 g.109990  ORF g.109990 m.109990 type:complete len:217 (-) comp9327_c0_seq1:31-681(-)